MSKKMNTKYMVLAALFIALGIILPQAFHVFGPTSGMTFLPIHLPVMMAGLILGPIYGGMVGMLVTILSGVLTGMPAVPKLYFMIFELLAYGLGTGVFIRRFKVVPSILLSMIVGRVVYGITLVVGVQVLALNYPFTNVAAFTSGVTTGVPGMIIQIVALPVIYKLSKRWVN